MRRDPNSATPHPKPASMQALQARLAELAGIGGFVWRASEQRFEFNALGRRLLGLEAGDLLPWSVLSERLAEPAAQQLELALLRLQHGDSTQEQLVLLLRPVSQETVACPLSLTLVRDDPQGECVFGWFEANHLGTVAQTPDHQSQIDALTGLTNRGGLFTHGSAAIIQARKHAHPLALLFIDLDHFKRINDTLGHHAGDEVLREVARRLRDNVRVRDIVARRSGDEFVIVLREINRPQDAALVAQKILDALLWPIDVAGQKVRMGCSIGAALLNEQCSDLQTLARAADVAMYAAKEAGRNTFRFYSDVFDQRQQRRSEREQELRRALAREELFLDYQPSVRLQDARIGSIEALLRWRAPSGELRQPAEFLPLAEETGEIVQIGDWVLRESCRQACIWEQQGLEFERISVNVAAAQLHAPDYPTRVLSTLEQAGWTPERLELEITESALMLDRDASRRTLGALRAQGVVLSLDDFGTGFSNWIYLQRFQIRALKLDRHFALGMRDDPALQDLSHAMIAMGHALRLHVVAKGIESEFAAHFLAGHGCDEGQGFHFARPMPAADVPLWAQARELALRTLRPPSELNGA